MSRSTIIVRTRAVLVVAVLAGCAQRSPHPPPASPPPTVRTEIARAARLQPAQDLPGLVAPYQNVAIQSSLAEPVDAVTVAEGDRVTRGEVLARLDTADLEAQVRADRAQAQGDAANAAHTTYQGALSIAQSDQSVNAAVATLREAEATLAKDATDLARDRSLLGSGYISEQAVAQQTTLVQNDRQAAAAARASLAGSRSAVRANGTLGGDGLQASAVEQARATQRVALAQADQVLASIAKATIVSPIDGVVVNRNVNVGEYPGTRQLFTLQQVDPIYAVLRGSGAQIARITAGAAALVRASDVSRTSLRGTVIGVLNQVNPGSTDFEVKVLLPNPAGRLRPGMPVTGSVTLPAVAGVAVSATAFTDDTHAAVYVVDARARVRTVRVTETATDGTRAIVAGLPAGSRVISDGQTSVGDGQTVAVR